MRARSKTNLLLVKQKRDIVVTSYISL